MMKSTRYRTTDIRECVDIMRNPNSGFDPEPFSIPEAFRVNAKKWQTHPAIVSKEKKIYTYKDYLDISDSFSKALIALGLQKHDVVCCIGFTSPEYLFTLQGSWGIGCVTAGIYTTNSADACHYILEHSEAKVCVCQGGSSASKIASLRQSLPNLKMIVVYWPEEGVPEVEDDGFAKIVTYSDFLNTGLTVFTKEIIERGQQVNPGDCASLIYTSGTTGNPKGVMISHDNAMFIAQSVRKPLLFDDNDRVVSYLPMNHIAAQYLDVMVPTVNRMTVFMAKPDALQCSLAETLRYAKPTILLAVPRVWEKFAESIHHEMLSYSSFKKWFVKKCTKIGAKACKSRQFGEVFKKPFLYKMADKYCFMKIRQQFGLEHCKSNIVAAAPVSEETLHFFNSFDIPLLDLYGQSEGTGPVTTNSHYNQDWKLYTSGKAFPGIECTTDINTNELLYKGRSVMMGYLKMETETYGTLTEDGWIHTGDQAKIDKDGFVTITGRLKELIVTAGGENISPVPIENKILENCPILANCVVVGDKRKFLSCLLTLKTVFNPLSGQPTNRLTPACINELLKNGIDAKTVEEAKNNPLVTALIDKAIEIYNSKAVSRAQNVRKWILLDRDLSLATGELTATLKLRRNVVQLNFKDRINQLYE